MIINFGTMSYPISNNSVDGGMTDLRGDMMKDFITLGIIFTVNCYISFIVKLLSLMVALSILSSEYTRRAFLS